MAFKVVRCVPRPASHPPFRLRTPSPPAPASCLFTPFNTARVAGYGACRDTGAWCLLRDLDLEAPRKHKVSNEDKYPCILLFTERAIHRCQRGKITLVDSVPPWSFREVPGVLEYGSCCSGDCAQVCHRRVVAEYRLRIDKQERVSTF